MDKQVTIEFKWHGNVTYNEQDVPKDIGQSLYDQGLSMDPHRRDMVAKKVKAKVDRALMPMVSMQYKLRYESFLNQYEQMIFMYFLAFLDKQALNYANAFSLQRDLHLRNYQ